MTRNLLCRVSDTGPSWFSCLNEDDVNKNQSSGFISQLEKSKFSM